MNKFGMMDLSSSPYWQLLAVCLCLIYFHIAGIIDGILWGKRGADSYKINEHVYLVASRALVIGIAWLPVHFMFIICLTFMFPMIHNGAYYLTRRQISGGKTYPKGWGSEPSETTTAQINFSFIARMVLGAIGIAGTFFTLLYY